MSRPKKSIVIASLTLSLVAITWTVIRATQKHDVWILERLQEEFTEDARFENVHFTVSAGFVSLKGSVVLLEDKRQAARRAGAVDHVRRVMNDITVIPPRIPAFALRMQLKRELRNQGLNFLKLKVRKGVVTVREIDPSTREQVLTLIAGTEGVRAIRDRTTLLE